MRKYARSAYALSALAAIALATALAMALAGGANAQQQGQNGHSGDYYDRLGKDGRTHSVPDSGSTAALLGSSLAIVVLAQRKFAIIK